MSFNNLNLVTLIGQINSDIKITENDSKKKAEFSIQTTEVWGKDGELKEKSEVHNVVVYNNRFVDLIKNSNLQKNNWVYLEGKLKYEKINENEKKTVISLEVVGSEFKIINSNKESCLNKVCLIGRVGSEIDFSTASDDKKIAKFSLATSEKWRDKISNELNEKTEWHKIIVYNVKIVEILQNYVKKGELILLFGKIKNENWVVQDTGQNRSGTSVVLDLNSTLKILSTKNNSQTNNTNNNSNNNKHDLEFDVDF